MTEQPPRAPATGLRRARPGSLASGPRTLARWVLGAFMIVAGLGHFAAHESFLQQTPTWVPWRPLVVWASGVVEIALGLGMLFAGRHRRAVGWALAAFLVAVFPGNVHQAVAGTDAFGLDTPTARWVRLLFQPVLIAWALWSTGAPDRREHGCSRR